MINSGTLSHYFDVIALFCVFSSVGEGRDWMGIFLSGNDKI